MKNKDNKKRIIFELVIPSMIVTYPLLFLISNEFVHLLDWRVIDFLKKYDFLSWFVEQGKRGGVIFLAALNIFLNILIFWVFISKQNKTK